MKTVKRKVRNQVVDQAQTPVYDLVRNQVYSQVWNQVRNQVRVQVWSAAYAQRLAGDPNPVYQIEHEIR
jgi:hypothetical protein